MYAILQTCPGTYPSDVLLTNEPPPGLKIDTDKRTWTYKGRTKSIGELWADTLNRTPNHPLSVLEFNNPDDYLAAKQAVAAANHFLHILQR